jgi:hypothetical protein
MPSWGAGTEKTDQNFCFEDWKRRIGCHPWRLREFWRLQAQWWDSFWCCFFSMGLSGDGAFRSGSGPERHCRSLTGSAAGSLARWPPLAHLLPDLHSHGVGDVDLLGRVPGPEQPRRKPSRSHRAVCAAVSARWPSADRAAGVPSRSPSVPTKPLNISGSTEGNKNALKHGNYTAEAIARRREFQDCCER